MQKKRSLWLKYIENISYLPLGSLFSDPMSMIHIKERKLLLPYCMCATEN